MDPGVRTPLVDFFRRGEVARDVRLVAAQGVFAPRALDQLALLLILKDDSDPEVARAAQATLERLPRAALEAFLLRSDVPAGMRELFTSQGVVPQGVAPASDDPLVQDDVATDPEAPDASTDVVAKKLAEMSVMERMKVAMRGTREQRSALVRDPNRLVSASVLSSPKLMDSEIESFARMTNVSEEVLRVIGTNRQWTKSYGVVAGLVRNPKTPLAISMNLLQRVNDRDIKMLALDRNVPEPLRLAARKRAGDARG
jgi:hypothetical protein